MTRFANIFTVASSVTLGGNPCFRLDSATHLTKLAASFRAIYTYEIIYNSNIAHVGLTAYSKAAIAHTVNPGRTSSYSSRPALTRRKGSISTFRLKLVMIASDTPNSSIKTPSPSVPN